MRQARYSGPENAITAGGTLNFYPNETIIEKLCPGEKMTRDKFSLQLSDYLPVWIQVKTDIDGFTWPATWRSFTWLPS